jgi:hypothetical protein
MRKLKHNIEETKREIHRMIRTHRQPQPERSIHGKQNATKTWVATKNKHVRTHKPHNQKKRKEAAAASSIDATMTT